MTAQQWAETAAFLENAWPGEFDEAREAAFAKVLGGFDFDVVDRALTVLARRGGAFRPSAAEIARECQTQVMPRQSWDESWTVIRAAFRHHYDPVRGVNGGAAVQDLAAAGEGLIALFVSRYGAERLHGEPVDHPDYGGKVRDRLQTAWDAHVDVSHDRLAAGQSLDPAGEAVARLEAGTGPRRLDPLSALGLPAPSHEPRRSRA